MTRKFVNNRLASVWNAPDGLNQISGYRLPNGKYYMTVIEKAPSFSFPSKYSFRTENGNDITSSIAPFLGPKGDFHGGNILITPKNTGHDYDVVIIRRSDGDTRTAGPDTPFVTAVASFD